METQADARKHATFEECVRHANLCGRFYVECVVVEGWRDGLEVVTIIEPVTPAKVFEAFASADGPTKISFFCRW